MTYSGNGYVTAPVYAVNLTIPPPAAAGTSPSACAAADFAGFPVGAIALVQRGMCDFRVKALNAQAAGAVGVVVMNEGQPGRTGVLNATLGGPGVTIPVVGATFAVGALAGRRRDQRADGLDGSGQGRAGQRDPHDLQRHRRDAGR